MIADLVERKILSVHRSSNSRRLLIDAESLNAFRNDYILVGTVAKQYSLNSTNLAEKLASLGVTPASFDALVTIYRRVDIENIDLDAVRSIASYKTLAGRKSTVDPSTVDDPRIKKLIQLIVQHGGQSNFCRKFGFSPGVLSLILRGKKTFGSLAARRMEERCGLEPGHLNY